MASGKFLQHFFFGHGGVFGRKGAKEAVFEGSHLSVQAFAEFSTVCSVVEWNLSIVVLCSLPLRPEATSLWLKKKRPLRELCFSHGSRAHCFRAV